ncbi:MAG: dihydrofolate reductase family protein [Reyranellales bacterium]
MHGEVAVFGSANLIRSLIPLGLIDRYQLLIFPPCLGAGNACLRRARCQRT